MSKKKNPPSDSNHTIHSAWINFAGAVIAAIIAAAVAFYLYTVTPTPTKAINQSVGNNNQGTVNQSGGDIYNAQ